jgi:hypothetical protein
MINDLNMKAWKEFQDDITTEAIWISSTNDKFYIPDRGYKQDAAFHGIFIPEIPYQMIKRYTKKGETVWDCFAGSGTTIHVARDLDRNIIANDLTAIYPNILQEDSKTFNPGKKVQLVIMHPPYHDIVKYSSKDSDLCNSVNLKQFYRNFRDISKNVIKYLDVGRYLILVCGHIYYNKEDVALGQGCKQILRRLGFACRGEIVKDYGVTKGALRCRENLEYYRAIKFGHWKFAGDNIFVMQKIKS